MLYFEAGMTTMPFGVVAGQILCQLEEITRRDEPTRSQLQQAAATRRGPAAPDPPSRAYGALSKSFHRTFRPKSTLTVRIPVVVHPMIGMDCWLSL